MNIANPVEQTKGTTVVTDVQEISIAKIFAQKEESNSEDYAKLFLIATQFAEKFKNDPSEERYLIPKVFKIHLACDIALNILSKQRVRMTLGAGQG